MRKPVKLNALSPYDASPVPSEITQTMTTSFTENALVPKANAARRIATGAKASAKREGEISGRGGCEDATRTQHVNVRHWQHGVC